MALVSDTSSSITNLNGSSSVSSTATSSQNVTRGLNSGKDTLTTAVESIVSVTQNGVTYTQGTDFSLSTNNTIIAWGVDSSGNALANAKIPTGGSVYVVNYTYEESTSLGTYSASISSNPDDSVYVSLSLKGAKLVSSNKDIVSADISDFISLLLTKMQAVANSSN